MALATDCKRAATGCTWADSDFVNRGLRVKPRRCLVCYSSSSSIWCVWKKSETPCWCGKTRSMESSHIILATTQTNRDLSWMLAHLQRRSQRLQAAAQGALDQAPQHPCRPAPRTAAQTSPAAPLARPRAQAAPSAPTDPTQGSHGGFTDANALPQAQICCGT